MAFPSIVDIMNHLQTDELPLLWKFITGGAFLVGLFFAIKSIYSFKEYGEMRVMSSANTDVRKPLAYLLIAIILMYSPFVAQRFMQTLFLTDRPTPPYVYSGLISGEAFTKTIDVLGDIVEFIGMIAFIRGWIIIVHTTQQQAQPGTLAKGIIHIIGGVFALNIFGTFKVLQATIGWKTGG